MAQENELSKITVIWTFFLEKKNAWENTLKVSHF